MFRIGVVGHRYLANKETVTFVGESSSTILKQMHAKHRDVRVISAIAEGADTILAEAAVALNIPLEIVRPFEGYSLDFTTPPAKQRYERLLSCASSETRLSHAVRSDAAYLAGMYWIVDNSSLVVAV